MSRDVYFRRVWKPDPPLNNQINEGEVGYDTPYRAFRLEEAEEWMKDVSQVVRIKRSHCDIFEACKKRFGKASNHARWLFHSDGYEFCDENGVPFGRLYRSDLEEFTYYTEEEEYVFQYEDVVEPMTDYAVQLEGIQSAQALLDEALRIISLDANEHDGLYHAEAIYALVKCHNLALKGEKIWIRFN